MLRRSLCATCFFPTYTNVEDDPFPTIMPMLGAFGSFSAPGSIEIAGNLSVRPFNHSRSGSRTTIRPGEAYSRGIASQPKPST